MEYGDEYFSVPYAEERKRNMELIDIKKLENTFEITLDLGFEKFVGEGNFLSEAIFDISDQLNWFCWKEMDDLVHLTRKYTENTPVWLENWCGSSHNKNIALTFGFKQKANDPYEIELVGSNGMEEILAEYKKGKSLAYIYREWKYNDIRLGATFLPRRKKHEEKFAIIVLREDNSMTLIYAVDNNKDAFGLGKKVSHNITEWVLEKIGNDNLRPDNREHYHRNS